MPIFFVTDDLSNAKQCSLSKADSHHVLKAMRYQVGDEILVVGQEPQIYQANISGILSGNIAQLNIISKSDHNLISIYPTTFIVSVLPGTLLQEICEKLTELGASRLIITQMKHSSLSWKGSEIDRKLAKLREYSQATCKQCERFTPLVIDYSPNLAKSLEQIPVDAHKFALLENYPGKFFHKYLGAAHESTKAAIVCIGPEGGWHESEKTFLVENNFNAITLGNGLLRVNTAVYFAQSVLKYQYESQNNKTLI